MTLEKTFKNICKSKEGFFNIFTIYVGVDTTLNRTFKEYKIYNIYENTKNFNVDRYFDVLKQNIVLIGINSRKPYRIINAKQKIVRQFF